ncbi:hypothetical protein FOCG_14080 [Fusarium oxysporum f. sp. radicis-lycopersici 26381]|uniref:DUF7918 domain-containing protein n=3 Tax=Fusarium oxysporum TaxID=5507 RepID=A0A420T9H3_FUSOX|nr:hypothetical protein FOWG_10602 [Fusarium oxysporum f. sp. lycopersici MN25]EXL43749.1 hypothetical protein FOCG_14080 [Fusarium oxysporum f. sp. radicis-lycopersici 26381]KAJ4126292.1 hypothetical protein NW765_002075 [Fusarium oxysporum]RKK28184.1 hypothetical protein BFJ65_g134 [Fusarium oxysporum f. sp. cepae]RYC87474.1 hypothetical protein BFJ63_vAg9637 [Fusarium oxysporum f. sp. narcissi]
MAVLDEVPLVTARVRVAGELATEYDPLDNQESVINLDKEGTKLPTRNCYIESKSGAEFAVEVTVSDKYRLPHSHDTLIAEVSIDGQMMESCYIRTPFSPGMPSTIVISSAEFLAEKERVVARKFVFAPITKTSDHISTDRLNNDIKQAETLGTIRLLLTTGRFEGPCFKKPLSWHGGRDVELAEKALKGRALSHATLLAETDKKPYLNRSTIGHRRLLGEIFFRYRSYQALQHEMIIPRTPSPKLSATAGLDEDSLSHLSESDIRRLALERLHDTQAKDEVSQVKREAAENPRTPRQWKFVRLEDGKEAVDLTDD